MKIIIVGRTGTGKSTLAKSLYDISNLKVLKTCTTRPRRPTESLDAYNFLTKEDADACENKLFPTTIGPFEYFAKLEDWQASDIAVIEPEGVYEFCEKMPNEKFVLVYVNAYHEARISAAMSRAYDPDTGETDDSEIERFYHRICAEDNRFTEFENIISSRNHTQWSNCIGMIEYHNRYSVLDSKVRAAQIADMYNALVENERKVSD